MPRSHFAISQTNLKNKTFLCGLVEIAKEQFSGTKTSGNLVPSWGRKGTWDRSFGGTECSKGITYEMETLQLLL